MPYHLIHKNKHRETVKMRIQKNIFQTKEQGVGLEKELNETESNNVPEKQF